MPYKDTYMQYNVIFKRLIDCLEKKEQKIMIRAVIKETQNKKGSENGKEKKTQSRNSQMKKKYHQPQVTIEEAIFA